MSRSARLGLVIYDTIGSDAGRVSAKVRTPHDNLFHKPYGGRQTPKRGGVCLTQGAASGRISVQS